MSESTRRHFSPEEKVAVLRRHLLEKVPVSDLCDQLSIAPTLFYRWQKEFFENGHLAFNDPPVNLYNGVTIPVGGTATVTARDSVAAAMFANAGATAWLWMP